jgi:hypothetical protein
MKTLKSKTSPIKFIAVGLFISLALSVFLSVGSPSSGGGQKSVISSCANSASSCKATTVLLTADTKFYCGSPVSSAVQTSIDFGCYGDACGTANPTAYCSGTHSPLIDLLFAIIRFLSKGVGIVVIGSIIVGGIQYIGSRGEPNATSMAINRIRSSVIALIIFIFAFAILNYIIPAGFFNQGF